jgi:hypothetical protein
MDNGLVEVKRRKTGETSEVSPEAALIMVCAKS